MADAISVASDFKVYEPEFNAGAFEALFQNSNIFNGASRNGIRLVTQVHQGHYLKQAYFSQIAGLVTRQDITSTANVDSKKLSQVEEAAVKLHRRIGPVKVTLKAFKMAGIDTPAGSFTLGRMIGDAVAKEMASIAIIAANAAVSGQTALINDVTGKTVKTATVKYFNETRLKWGDQLTKLRSWVMHSKVFGDFTNDGLDISLESVAGTLFANGNVPGLMGGGLIVSDNANLVNSGTTNTYNTIGLAEDALLVRQSELQNVVIKMITGNEQLELELQGEYAVTVGVDGFTWDITNGGSNPNDTALGTSSNWDKVRTDTTGLPLVKLLSE